MKFYILYCLSALCIVTVAGSQTLPEGAVQRFPGQIQWVPAPPPFPPGAQLAILEGNPKTAGFFTMRIKFPPYYHVPAHIHPLDERVTVILGAVSVGFGEQTDTTKATMFTAGCFYVNPAGAGHYVFTGIEGAVIQISGTGPWGITYLEK